MAEKGRLKAQLLEQSIWESARLRDFLAQTELDLKKANSELASLQQRLVQKDEELQRAQLCS